MAHKITSKQVATLRDLIEAERKRLQALRLEKSDWWNDSSRSDWARREFGDDLCGDINEDTLRMNAKECQVCGKGFPLDERFMHLEFSFCDEYDCDMNICRKCLKALQEELEE